MITRKIKLVLLAMTCAATVLAATETTSTNDAESNRVRRRFGVYAGFFGDPFPTIIGLNAAYNALDFLRLTAGFGQVSSSLSLGGQDASATATTFGAGARFLVPGWSLSPMAGLSFAYVDVTQSGGMTMTVNNFATSGAHVYGSLGLDWQASSGFNVGAGYNLSFKSGVGGQPYLNLGWYFDFI